MHELCAPDAPFENINLPSIDVAIQPWRRAHSQHIAHAHILSLRLSLNVQRIFVTFELTDYILISRSKSVRLNELKSFN